MVWFICFRFKLTVLVSTFTTTFWKPKWSDKQFDIREHSMISRHHKTKVLKWPLTCVILSKIIIIFFFGEALETALTP